jgi:hypothetical protein
VFACSAFAAFPSDSNSLTQLPPSTLRTSRILTASRVTISDLTRSTREEQVAYAAKWFYGSAGVACRLRWLGDSGWPLCADIPLPPDAMCVAYSIGPVRNALQVKTTLSRTYSCNVRIFDDSWPNDLTSELENGMHVHRVALSNFNDDSRDPPVATLATILSLEYDVAFNVYAFHMECGNCAFKAISQLYDDVGPNALRFFGMLLVTVDLQSIWNEPIYLAGFAAAMQAGGFRVYWRAPLGACASADLLQDFNDIVTEIFGEIPQDDTWSTLSDVPPASACSFRMALARDSALPPLKSLTERYFVNSECATH